ncbi:RES family NAD+ phosphorylase [Telmatospirillum sp.]|uniref:RES family NAD+ phosphorylase n=1 Tax=Telmatospirillum sp. TaxID=2079197 RepID=UPI002847080E|nr:RES family NAD+ phosphorylase [Telmatospirillum sp.]MDR3439427.1 RES family NAD+ phosphorylase [Telmatospirillum sp.]
MKSDLPRTKVPDLTYRVIPSCYPPIPAFASVAQAADLNAVMELEGWTNDRLVKQRVARLAQSEWVYGTPNASVVMASFLHAAPAGLRFSGPELGAWYAGLSLNTSIAEVAHHLRRELVNTGKREMSGNYRTYTALHDGSYVDIRGRNSTCPALYDPVSYAASQVFGEAVRASNDNGIVYDSVRLLGGTNVVCHRPRAILSVTQTTHFEITVRAVGKILVRPLS